MSEAIFNPSFTRTGLTGEKDEKKNEKNQKLTSTKTQHAREIEPNAPEAASRNVNGTDSSIVTILCRS